MMKSKSHTTKDHNVPLANTDLQSSEKDISQETSLYSVPGKIERAISTNLPASSSSSENISVAIADSKHNDNDNDVARPAEELFSGKAEQTRNEHSPARKGKQKESWRRPRKNTWRLVAVCWAFLNFGLNDASYGVRESFPIYHCFLLIYCVSEVLNVLHVGLLLCSILTGKGDV